MKQIRSSEEIHIDQSRRRAFASRSMLPAALALFSQDVKSSVDWLRAGLTNDIPHDDPELNDEHLRTPFQELDLEKVFEAIRDCIENSEPPFRDLLADLVAKHQIKSARMEGIQKREFLFTTMNIYDSIYDNLEISMILSKLYPYARRLETVDDDRTDLQRMENAANINGCYLDANPILKRMIHSRHK